jgi:hypothetical protein
MAANQSIKEENDMNAKVIWGFVLGLALVPLAAPAGAPANVRPSPPKGTCSATNLATAGECLGERWSSALKTCVCAPAGACAPPPNYGTR